MRRRLARLTLVAGLLAVAACSSGDDDAATAATDPATTDPPATVATTDPPATDPPATEAPSTEPPTTESTTTTSTTTTVAPTTVVDTTTTTTTTTLPSETTTTAVTVVCTLAVAPGDSLNAIVARIGDPAITLDGITRENSIPDPNVINAGAVLDICIDNGIDDVNGVPREAPTTAPPTTVPVYLPPPPTGSAPAGLSGVPAQQQKLNELFAGYGIAPLSVDGASGRLTEQQLCAARVALGLPNGRSDMEVGSLEEVALMQASGVPIPAGAPIAAGKWVLIDQTCQVMFVGDGASLVHVFATSTGQAEYPTRDQDTSARLPLRPGPRQRRVARQHRLPGRR